MTRAQSILSAAVVLFVLLLLIWGVTTNLKEKRNRDEADRDAFVNAYNEAKAQALRGPPVPPVIMDDFRKDVRKAVAPGSEQAAERSAEEVTNSLLKARDTALKAVSERVEDPAPYVAEWKQVLENAEQEVLDEVAAEGARAGGAP